MGVCAGKPVSRYVTGQLSLLPIWVDKSSTSLWLGLRWGVFTCVGWQATLCDPIQQVTPHT